MDTLIWRKVKGFLKFTISTVSVRLYELKPLRLKPILFIEDRCSLKRIFKLYIRLIYRLSNKKDLINEKFILHMNKHE